MGKYTAEEVIAAARATMTQSDSEVIFERFADRSMIEVRDAGIREIVARVIDIGAPDATAIEAFGEVMFEAGLAIGLNLAEARR